MEAVDVVFDGELYGRKWWILHIEPTGAVNIWRRSSSSSYFQIVGNEELGLEWNTLGAALATFMNSLIASINIEGLYKADAPNPVGGVETLSEITYKVVQVSE